MEKEKTVLDKTMEQLESGIAELFASDKYQQYLDTMSKFHNYSVNNCILIAMQKPEATLVASYSAWQKKFKRQVMQGEKGMTIIAPNPVKRQLEQQVFDSEGRPVLDAEGKPVMEKIEAERFNSFRVVKVFDISQTEGEPIPELVTELTNPVEDFDDLLDSVKELSPVPIRFDTITTSANGYYSPQKMEIVIKRGLPEEQTIKTLIHEVAHAKLGHGGDEDTADRCTHEVQAESVAYCTCKALGLDTSDYSFGYIAGWSSDKDVKELKASLQTIRNVSDSLISGIQHKMDTLKIRHQEYELSHPVKPESIKLRMSM